MDWDSRTVSVVLSGLDVLSLRKGGGITVIINMWKLNNCKKKKFINENKKGMSKQNKIHIGK